MSCIQQCKSRVHDAILLENLPQDTDIEKTAQKVACAEAFQIVFYATLTTVFGLTAGSYITPFTAGVITLSLLPLEIVAYYNTMIVYGKVTRVGLTIMAALTLGGLGGGAILGVAGDYSWTMCGGGFLVHMVRMIGERNDFERREILHRKLAQHHKPPQSEVSS